MGPILSYALGMLLSKAFALSLPEYTLIRNTEYMSESKTFERGKKSYVYTHTEHELI